MFPDALRIDLLDPASHREYAARPEKLAEIVKANPGKQQVVLDEVQKVPELLEIVHSLIEAKSGAPRIQRTLAAYNGLYLREEVQMDGLVRNIGAFARFLEAISVSHAGILNWSNMRASFPPVDAPAARCRRGGS